ncbi:response regulator transcription factor [Pseudonocardia aurantiaca]|uniref:Response regulator transcription factor n=1 Tax=Pseudonocardia aurantiaca TaxID=75290 RepID=A0ABW4FF92_9PSEU
MTSPQIAARLHLSPRTVQTHISHSLRKLGLRSRSELAATVARHHRCGSAWPPSWPPTSSRDASHALLRVSETR